MKRILFSLLLLAPFFASAQNNSFKYIKQDVYTASGTDTYTIPALPGMLSYVPGFEPKIKFTNANTGAATLEVGGLGAIALKKNGTTDLDPGDLAAGVTKRLSYDGTYFQVLEIGGSGGSLSGSGTTNEIPYWVSGDVLGSLSTATYPSLTELSYVKGVTSSLQTQLGLKWPSTGTFSLTGDLTIQGTHTLQFGAFLNELTGFHVDASGGNITFDADDALLTLSGSGSSYSPPTNTGGFKYSRDIFSETGVTDRTFIDRGFGNSNYWKLGGASSQTDNVNIDNSGYETFITGTGDKKIETDYGGGEYYRAHFGGTNGLKTEWALDGSNYGSYDYLLGVFSRTYLGNTSVINFNGSSVTTVAGGTTISVNSTGLGITSSGKYLTLQDPTTSSPSMMYETGGTVPSTPSTGWVWPVDANGGMLQHRHAGVTRNFLYGPTTSVNNRVAFFDGTTGGLIKDSGLTLSGSNTGDQTITLTGDVTGSGTGSFAATIAAGAIVNADINASAAIDFTKLSGTSNALSSAVTDASRVITSGADALVQADNGRTVYIDYAGTTALLVDILALDTQIGIMNIGSGDVSIQAGTATLTTVVLPGWSGTGNPPTAFITYVTTTNPIVVASETHTTEDLFVGSNASANSGYGLSKTSNVTMSASGSAYIAIPFAATYPNNTVLVVEATVTAIKSDGTEAAYGSVTSMFRKNNSSTWVDDIPGSGTTSNATVIAALTGDIALSSQPVLSIVYGAFSGTWTLGVTYKTSSHQY